MANNHKAFSLKDLKARLLPAMREVSEAAALVLLESSPLVGYSLASDRRIPTRLSTIFETDDEIQRDIEKIVQNLAETESMMIRLNMHIENRKNEPSENAGRIQQIQRAGRD